LHTILMDKSEELNFNNTGLAASVKLLLVAGY
jgi:hypothetical protein